MSSFNVKYIDLSKQHEPLHEELMGAFEGCLRDSNFIMGNHVAEFEEDFAKFTQSEYAVGVNSGTTALHLALLALGIGPGDEVITTPFTFAATCWAISYVGAKPVFVDIEAQSYNIDPEKLKDAVTPKTKAVIPVHLYGHPCDMDPIVEVCNEHDLYLIEDAAQAHGARYKGEPVGSFGHVATYSFYPAKNLGALGEGGAVTTNDPQIAEKMKLLRNHGSRQKYHYEEVGYNYRMEALQGAFLKIKLKHLDAWNAERLRIATDYHCRLGDVDGVQVPLEQPWAESVFHLYSILAKDVQGLCKHFDAAGIGYARHYPIPMHLQECYKELGCREGSLPIAEQVADKILCLPLYPGMPDGDVEKVCEAVYDFYGVGAALAGTSN